MTLAVKQNIFASTPGQNARGRVSFLPFPRLSSGSMNEALLASSPAALCLIDRHNRLILVNDAMATILGESREKLVGRLATDLFAQADDRLARYHMLAEREKPLPSISVVWQGKPYQLCFNPMRGSDGRILGLSVAAFNSSHRAGIEQRLRASRRRLLALIRQDHLTGLLNRKGLELKINNELRRSRRANTPLGLLIVDIDSFKAFNDGFGHAAGDECLRSVANAIHGCLRRPADAASRYGGEEFILVLPDTDRGGALKVAERCRQAVERLQIAHPASPYGHVTISIGLESIAPKAAPCVFEALESADRALYRAKGEGRNRISLSGHRDS